MELQSGVMMGCGGVAAGCQGILLQDGMQEMGTACQLMHSKVWCDLSATPRDQLVTTAACHPVALLV